MRVFRARFAQDEDALPQHPAWMRWWRPRGVGARMTQWMSGAVLRPNATVALYAHDAEPGEPAAIVFPVEAASLPEGAEQLDEVLVFGDPVVNGCLVVEGRGGLIWPVYNPRPPGPKHPRR